MLEVTALRRERNALLTVSSLPPEVLSRVFVYARDLVVGPTPVRAQPETPGGVLEVDWEQVLHLEDCRVRLPIRLVDHCYAARSGWPALALERTAGART
jgi:hypothetical protein